MTSESLDDAVEHLLGRLKEAQEIQDDPSNSSDVTYCVDCDKMYVDEIDDCPPEHLTLWADGYEYDAIGPWIWCIEYLQDEGLLDS